MKRRVFRQRKSHSLMWMAYFLAFLTLMFFLLIFLSFLGRGLVALSAGALSTALPAVLFSTFEVFGWAYLVAVPWAFLLTMYGWRQKRTWAGHLVELILKIYLRTPPIIIGILLVYLLQDFAVPTVLSAVVGCLALPRLVNGWLYTLHKAPRTQLDAGLALGMTSSTLFFRIYWPRYWVTFVEHWLKVTGVLAGAVAPFVYLTSFSLLADKPLAFLSLEVFRELVKGNDGTTFVWAGITALTIFVLVLTVLDEQPAEEAPQYA